MKLGRFSGKVEASRAKRPEGVSRTEGWWLLLLASLIALFVLSRLLSKGVESSLAAIIYTLSPLLFIALAVGVAVRIVSTRGVQPRGWRILFLFATFASMTCAAGADFFWQEWSGGGFDVILAALMAVVSGIPVALMATWKLKAGS